MFDRDKWQEIYATLAKNKLRTLLTALGVFWGIFMLIVMQGSGKGLENGVTGTFGNMATNSFFLWTQRTSKPFAGLPQGRSFSMNNDDVQAIKDQIAEAAVVAPRNQLGGYMGGNNVTKGVKSGAFSVNGDMPEIAVVQSLNIFEGRFLNLLDIQEKRKVAVIGTRVQEVLFEKNEDPIGQYIRINGVYFKIIGIFNSTKSGGQADREVQTIFLPFSTFQQAFNFGNRVGWFAITAKDGVAASVVEEKVLNLLKQRHRIAPDDDRAFGHWNAEEEFNKFQGLFAAIRTLIWIVGSFTLLAGVVGVSNIMLIIIKERTKEIGIRRAIGATPSAIVSQILLESIVLTSVAGYLGLVAGVGVLELVNSFTAGGGDSMFKNPEIQFGTAVAALVVLVIAGALAGFIPAKRALSISPVDALRAD